MWLRVGTNNLEAVNIDTHWGLLTYISYMAGTTKEAIAATADLTMCHLDTPEAEDNLDFSSVPIPNPGGKAR